MSKKNVNWNDLEHQTHQLFVKNNLAEKKIIVALSGGMDSVICLHVLNSIAQALNLKLRALHVHHGDQASPESKKFRDQALDFCKELCEKLKIPLDVSKNEHLFLESEQELRDFRHEKAEEFLREHQYDFLVTGHHQQDLLETRLLRLIRGTGPQGLKAMSFKEGLILRPLLGIHPKVLGAYADEKHLFHVEDPSNQQSRYLRNWIRHSWLKDLEVRSPGAQNTLARSLELMSEHIKSSQFPEGLFAGKGVISRKQFLALTTESKKQAIANCLLQLNHKNYSQGQIIEILKQLDKSQNEHIFVLSQCKWLVNAEQIRVQLEKD